MLRRGDERAVSVQIGAALLLAIVVIALSMYQVNVVPENNLEVESSHNQDVQTQLLDVRNGIVSASDGSSHTISLGTKYPSRAMLVNPPPASGTIGTTDRTMISIDGATITGNELGNVPNELETKAITYEPHYNEYASAPKTVYEHSLLYNEHESAAVTLSDQKFFDGETISIVTVDGDLSTTRSDSVPIEIEPISRSSNTVRVTGDGRNINITLSVLNADAWNRTALESKTNVVKTSVSDGPGEYENLTIELDGNESYDLRTSKVGVGSGAEREGPSYVTPIVGDGASIPEGSSVQLVAEVRDRYNNPVSGVGVNVTRSTNGDVRERSKTSGDDGRVRFTYDAEESGDGEIDVTIETGDGTDDAASFTVNVLEQGAAESEGLHWRTSGDWNRAHAERGVVHDDFGDRDGARVSLGYPRDDRWTATPLAYWPFDEDSDETAVDVTNAGNDGTSRSNVTIGDGGVFSSTGYRFDGTDDSYVTVSSGLNRWLGGSGTVSAWIKTTQAGDDTFYQAPGITGVESNGDGNDVFWGWIDGSGRVGIQVGDDGSAKSTDPITDGAWHHVVVTRDADSGEARVYVDGTLDDEASLETETKTTPFSSLGRIENSGETFDGSMDEVRIYDRALTEDEVSALYGASQGGSLTTDWRSSEEPLDSANLALTDLTVDVPEGTTLTVHVESDHNWDGERDERGSVTFTESVDGGTIDVPGLATDSDRFRLRIEFETDGVARTPIVSEAGIGRGGAEQDPDPETGSIGGTITDSETGATLSDASVTALEPGTDAPVGSATTNSQGRYEIVGLDQGQYELRVERDGYDSVVRESVRVEAGEPTETVDVALERELPRFDSLEAAVNVDGNFWIFPYSQSTNISYEFAPEEEISRIEFVVIDSNGNRVGSETLTEPDSPTTVSYGGVINPVIVRAIAEGPGGTRCLEGNASVGETIAFDDFEPCG